MLKIIRHPQSPILKPDPDFSWQALAVFNGCPIKKGNKTHLLFRAISRPQYNTVASYSMPISTIGQAISDDGINFKEQKSFIIPEHKWERFGCEDPRITKIEGTYYIFYTALSSYPFSADGIKVGVALTKNLKNITAKHLVTPFNAKAMALFPERINGKLVAILSVNTDRPPAKMSIIYFDEPSQIWSESRWRSWYKKIDKNSLDLQREIDDLVEVGAPPIKTKLGWLLIYSHINHYGKPNTLFGIEAVLLDKNNPLKIIARTKHPLMVPEDLHELYGMVPNVIFPSGVLINKDELSIYYGASDTTCCLAKTSLSALLTHILPNKKKPISFKRSSNNPILRSIPEHSWEKKNVFNPAAFYADGKVHIVYRAMAEDGTSVLGYATSKDGITIDERLSEPIYIPRAGFEKKKEGSGYSGCEDPRITIINNILYMCYTAFDGKHPPRVALTSIPLKSFLDRKWDWRKPVLISAPGLDDKDAAIFPEKINGKYLIFHRIGDDIDIAMVDSLDFDGHTWIEERRWLKQRREYWDNRKVGIAGPPLKTSRGWILLYHGVSKNDGVYRVGAVLLDLKDPTKIIGRTEDPLFEPEADYEKEGEVPNVVFPCGNVIIKDKIYIYYGGADRVIGVATIKINDLLNLLLNNN